MVETILAAYGLIHVSLLVLSFRWEGSAAPRLWLLRLLLIGMAYDNAVMSISGLIGDSNVYAAINYPRYIFHAAFLPFLTLFGLSIMGDAGISVARNSGFRIFCFLFTAAALAYGFIFDVLPLELVWTEVFGHRRMIDASTSAPIATISTNILIIPMAFFVWRKTQWPWFILGATFILILNSSFGGYPWGFLVGNGAELVFVSCLLFTHRRFGKSSFAN